MVILCKKFGKFGVKREIVSGVSEESVNLKNFLTIYGYSIKRKKGIDNLTVIR